jgi:XTP/dITP diphosphohydrolase
MSLSLRGEKILIATHNKGKLEEFREILGPLGVDVTSAGEQSPSCDASNRHDHAGR